MAPNDIATQMNEAPATSTGGDISTDDPLSYHAICYISETVPRPIPSKPWVSCLAIDCRLSAS